MPAIKTAVSLEDTLFERVEQIAHEMKMSRSRLVTLALEDFLRRHDSRTLLETLNATCVGTDPDPVESRRMEGMRRHHRRLVVDEW